MNQIMTSRQQEKATPWRFDQGARSLLGATALALALVAPAFAQPRPPFGRPPAPPPSPSPSPTATPVLPSSPSSTSALSHVSGFGMPLAGLLDPANGPELLLFADGQRDFLEVEELPVIGPIMNGRSCGGCHFQPAAGGSGASINEMRVRHNPAGGPLHIFASDNFLRLGPQRQGRAGEEIFTQGVAATPMGCQITSPGCRRSPCQREEAKRTTFSPLLKICDPTSQEYRDGENCVAERQSTPLFGLGLVEAVSDDTLMQLAAHQPSSIRGVVKTIDELGATRVGRFGWKNDHATLRIFAGDAYLNEMGVTSPDFPQERSTCALNQVRFGVTLDQADDPEDSTGDDGFADVDKFASFMRALAPPPRVVESESAQLGHRTFDRIGCGGCHVETLTTSSNPGAVVPPTTGGVPLSSTMNQLLASQTFHPFSDFLLHDMGALGDGITSDAAGPTMMRTAPLWGLRGRSRFLHDGRTGEVAEAIHLHAGQAAESAMAFDALSEGEQQQLLDFLDTL